MTATLGSICALLLFTVLLLILSKKNQQNALFRQQFYYELEAFRDRIMSYEHRIEIVERHATAYMNSLGPEVNDRLQFTRHMILDLYDLVEELEELFSKGDFSGLRAVLLFLSGDSDNFLPTWTAQAKETLFRLRNWESDIEDTLQSVGHGVARASDRRRSLLALKSPFGGEPPTIRSLLEANIKLDL